MDASFGPAFRHARTSPGYVDEDLRSLLKPFRLNSMLGLLSIGEQLPLTGRLETFIAFLFATCKIFEAQQSTASQGVLRRDAFIGLIGSTGVGEAL